MKAPLDKPELVKRRHDTYTFAPQLLLQSRPEEASGSSRAADRRRFPESSHRDRRGGHPQSGSVASGAARTEALSSCASRRRPSSRRRGPRRGNDPDSLMSISFPPAPLRPAIPEPSVPLVGGRSDGHGRSSSPPSGHRVTRFTASAGDADPAVPRQRHRLHPRRSCRGRRSSCRGPDLWRTGHESRPWSPPPSGLRAGWAPCWRPCLSSTRAAMPPRPRRESETPELHTVGSTPS